MKSSRRIIRTPLLIALFFFVCSGTSAQEAKTFILDTNFEFKSSAAMFSREYFYWNPPFVGGARLALMPNGQLMVTRTAAEPGRSGLMRLNADGSVDESFQPEIPAGALYAVSVDRDANVYAAVRGGGSNAVFKLNRKGERIWATQVETQYSDVAKLLVRRDGTVLVCGSFTNIAGVNRQSVALLSADGTVRPDFDLGLDGPASCAVENADGSFFVGGDFERVKGELKMRLVKIRPDGSVDEAFNPGTALTEDVTAIGVDGDGRIVVSGHFNPGNGALATRLLRLLPNGAVDPEFRTGAGLDGAAAAIDFDDAGRTVLAGAFTRVNGILRPRIARLLEDGALDESYKPGTGLNDTATDFVIDEAGKYVVTGYFGKVGHRRVPGLARLLNHSDLRTVDFADAIFMTSEIYGGTGINLLRFGDSSGELVARVALVPGNDPELSEFAPFETEVVFGPGQTLKVVSIPLADDGLVEPPELVALRCVVPSAGMESSAAIQVWDNEEPVTFARKFSALDVIFVEPVAAARNGKVAVGGLIGFGVSTHHHPWGVVVFDENGAVDRKFGFVMVEANEELRVRAVNWTADGKLLIGGHFSHVRNGARNNLARLNADGTLDATFRADVPPVFHMASLPDGKILTAPRAGSSLTRLLPSGEMDTAFQPEVTGFIKKMVVQPNGKILLHGEWLPLVRLLPDGKKDPEFTSPFDSFVDLTDIAVAKDGKIYVTGNFAKVQGLDRPGLVRLMPNGAVDLGFQAQGFSAKLVLKQDGKVVVGTGGGLVLLNEDGSRASDFTWSLQSYRPTQPLVELSDGRVLANVEWSGGEYKGLQILQLTNKASSQLVFDTLNLILREGTSRPASKVKRIGDVSKALTAVLSINDPSAGDIIVSREVKFAALQTEATIDVGTIADGVIEEDEVHRVTVSGPNLVGSDFEVVVLDNNARPGSAVVDPRVQTVENGFALAPIDDDAVIVAQGAPPYLLKIDRSEGTKQVFNALEDFNYAPRSIVAAGDQLLVGGLQIMAGPHVGRLVRLNRDGSKDTTFKEPVLRLNPAFIVPQSDGKILVAGEFMGGENVVYNYALLNSDGTITRKYPGIEPALHRPAVVNGKLIYHVRTTEHWGTVERVYTLDLASGVQVGGPIQVDGPVLGIVAEAQSALVYGAINQIGGLPVNGIARMKNGVLDPAFRPEILPKEVRGAQVDEQGRILILGSFQRVNGVEVGGLARLLPDGSLDEAFKPGGPLPPPHQILYHSIVKLGDGNYAALGNTAWFSNIGVVWINGNLPLAGRFSRRLASSPLNLVFNTEPGKRYNIEASTDFSAWESIVETNAVGFEIWLDPPTDSGMKFYRAMEPN